MDVIFIYVFHDELLDIIGRNYANCILIEKKVQTQHVNTPHMMFVFSVTNYLELSNAMTVSCVFHYFANKYPIGC